MYVPREPSIPNGNRTEDCECGTPKSRSDFCCKRCGQLDGRVPGQARIIATLRTMGYATAHEVALVLGVTSRTVQRLLATLVQAGRVHKLKQDCNCLHSEGVHTGYCPYPTYFGIGERSMKIHATGVRRVMPTKAVSEPCVLCSKLCSRKELCYGCMHYVCDGHTDPDGPHSLAQHIVPGGAHDTKGQARALDTKGQARPRNRRVH